MSGRRMVRALGRTCVAVLTLLAGCHSPPAPGFDVSLSALDPAAAEGATFELKFLRTPGPTVGDGLEVSLVVAGYAEYLLPWVPLADVDRNGRIDPGDSLLVIVPDGEVLELVELHRDFRVTVLVPADNGHRQVWTGPWTPHQATPPNR